VTFVTDVALNGRGFRASFSSSGSAEQSAAFGLAPLPAPPASPPPFAGAVAVDSKSPTVAAVPSAYGCAAATSRVLCWHRANTPGSTMARHSMDRHSMALPQHGFATSWSGMSLARYGAKNE
jgi:hypothetical protein